MEAVAAGDQAAFARLMAEQSPRLLRFVSALLGSVADAEELVQEALIRLWRQAEDWRPDGLVSTWLHRVAYRLAIDAIRRRKTSVGLEGLEDVLPDDSLPHDERLVRDEESRRLSRAIDALPERQRTALLLCHFQELSQAEAAAVMGIGEHAYESLLARARRKLRGMMTGEPDSRGEGHDV
jgi:RNA polymerase sigma-70 factor (ECF subfamily)